MEEKGWIGTLEPLWGEWEIVDCLGEGSSGRVWRVGREKPDSDNEYEAVKEMVISLDEGNYRQAWAEGLDEAGSAYYFQSVMEETKQEIELMQELSFCKNIVQFKACEAEKLPQKIGWIILIRMELLQSFKERLMERNLQFQDVLTLGIDICKALEACEEKGIVHRDIKPENLFWEKETDTYKLGDFGISHYLHRPTEGKGRAGTLTHMPPEVFQGASFTPGADLYALGMILYRLLNDNRIPFLPDYPKPFTPRERDHALMRKLKGEEVPLPSIIECAKDLSVHQTKSGMYFEESDRDSIIKLGELVKKAIAANAKERFENAKEMRLEMERLK